MGGDNELQDEKRVRNTGARDESESENERKWVRDELRARMRVLERE